MKKIIITSLLFASSYAHSALPPGAESLRRMRAIAESSDVFNAFGSAEWIKSIQDSGDGNYTVSSNKCTLKVKVEVVRSETSRMVSPLKVTVGKLECSS